jgi:hypothetical protein
MLLASAQTCGTAEATDSETAAAVSDDVKSRPIKAN